MADNIEVIAALRDLISRPAGRATAALHSMEQQLEDLNRDFVAGTITAEQYGAALRRISRTSRLAGRDSEKFRRSLRDMERNIGRGRRRGLRGILSGMGDGLSDLMKKFTSLSKLIPALKLPALGAAFSVLIPIVGALGGGLAALVGHFGPMIGLVAALPGLFLAAGSAMGVFALALGGMSEAVSTLLDPDATLEDINKAFENKTPAFKEFAVVIAGMKTPFQQLRDSVQESLLPQLGRTVQKLGDTYFPFFRDQLSRLGTTIGGIAEKFGEMATSASWMKDMRTIWDSNNRVVGELGGGIVHLVSALRGVMVAFAPTLEKMSRGFHNVMTRFDNFANSVEGRTSMGQFFDRALEAARQFWSILKNLAIALWNISNIGRGMGAAMGGSMEETMIRFREWTESAKGQNRIKQFFEDIKETLSALGRLFGAIGKEFGRLAGGSGEQNAAVSFLDGLTQAVPGIFKVIEGLIRLAGFIGKVMSLLGPTGTFLLGLAMIFGRVVGALAPLAKILWRVGGFLLQRLLIPAITALAAVIGWPITIVLLLAAAFVILYKKSETFRNLIQGAGEWFMSGLGWVKEKVIDPIIDAVKDLIEWIGKIDFPDIPNLDIPGVNTGFNNGKDDWGWGRKDGGPVWPGQTFNVGEQGRELFVGSSGNVGLLEAGQKRFSEPGVVIPNPVTEAILQGVTAPSMASAGPSGMSRDDYLAAMPPIAVDARGLERQEAVNLIAAAIRASREQAETRYGGKP